MRRITPNTALIERVIVAGFSASLLLIPAIPANAGAFAPPEERAKLHTLFDDEWQWTLAEYPEFASGVGDDRYNELTDLRASAIERRKAHDRDVLRRIRAIDRAGYKIGELKIKELRARATEALEPKLNIRKFHNALIDDGSLPLDLLEGRINDWITSQQ